MSGTRISPFIIPNLPRDSQIVDKNGNLTESWRIFFDQFILSLQTNFKTEGYVIPAITDDQLALLIGAASKNNIVYDSVNNEFKGNVNGSWKTFTLV